MPTANHAVIVYGKHHSGKSYTLKHHFKPRVGLTPNGRVFNETDSQTNKPLIGEIRTQSFEEAGRTLQSTIRLLNSLAKRDLLVVATRPPNEAGSLYHDVEANLQRLGFIVSSVEILNHNGPQNPVYYQGRAIEIHNNL